MCKWQCINSKLYGHFDHPMKTRVHFQHSGIKYLLKKVNKSNMHHHLNNVRGVEEVEEEEKDKKSI